MYARITDWVSRRTLSKSSMAMASYYGSITRGRYRNASHACVPLGRPGTFILTGLERLKETPMKLATVAAVVTATLAAALLVQATATPAAQDKPAAGSRTGVLNLRDCLDWTRNSWIADIDLE